METVAALITGKAGAAISAIVIEGPAAYEICRKLTGKDELELKTGSLHLCSIYDGGETIDEVLIGREKDEKYVINCHGNPLIVEKILSVCENLGASRKKAEEYAALDLSARFPDDAISAEVRLAFCKKMSAGAVEIICAQAGEGLKTFVESQLEQESIDVGEIHSKCRRILKDSAVADYIFNKQRIVLAGLPNSGKSTLFNSFCGTEAAIVTDVCGTTRDWVSSNCSIGPLNVELIDTAGLDRKLCGNDLDLAAQKKTIEIIQAADMILLVMDIGETMQRENLAIEQMIVDSDSEALLVKIYNKIDIYPPELTNAFNEYPAICAASPEGVQRAAQAIIDACGVGSITSSSTICFTDRQKRLMEKIIDNDSEEAIREHLELLRSGSLSAR